MLKAKDIMSEKFVTVSLDTAVRRICNLLIKNRLSGLPVVKDGKKLMGFVSERDIIASTSERGFLKKKAKDVMTRKVVSVKEDVSAEQVSKIFTQTPFRYVPVTRKGAVIGIISRKQMINRLLGQYY